MEESILRAIIAGLGIAIAAGSLGCFVVWRKMAYFSESLAHSALLGFTIGFIADISQNISIIAVSFVFALILLFLQRKKILAIDTLLGVLAHAFLSAGLIIASLLSIDFDLHSYFFGDIMTVTIGELYWIYGSSFLILSVLFLIWPALLLLCIHEELAIAEKVSPFLTHAVLMFLMTILVAVSLQIFGILLITSMLVIPAASARQLARSPEAMAVLASIIGAIAVVSGVFGAVLFETPAGPSIVLSSSIICIFLFTTASWNARRQKTR